MSGIYLKGMEMPKKCAECPFFVRSDSPKYPFVDCKRIGRLGSVFNAASGIPVDCPLVPVPEHGRLGDLDELEKTFREDADAEWNRFASPVNWADAFDDVANMIADAPTIIPASGGNEDE